jgi:DNA-binding CsgD family transcriptional regulator
MNMHPGFLPKVAQSDAAYLYSKNSHLLKAVVRKRSFIDNITSIAAAIRASYVLTLDGSVLVQSEFDQGPLNGTPSPVHIAQGKLWSFNPIFAQQLKQALSNLETSNIEFLRNEHIGSLISLRKIVIHDEPLIFVRLAEKAQPSACEISTFGKAYGLTKTECAVVQALCCGNTPDGVSDVLHIAITTVRTHIKNILHKTSSGDIRRLVVSVGQALG